MSGQGLEVEAELSRGYASRILKGGRIRLGPPTLRRIASVLRVDYEWLATGLGEMDARPQFDVPHTDGRPFRYANLKRAIDYWPGRWIEATIEAARTIKLQSDEDLTPQAWTEKLDALDVVIRKALAGEEVGRPVEETPRPPRRPAPR
jgi:transcriptional regulator with XRE-family HTH domain